MGELGETKTNDVMGGDYLSLGRLVVVAPMLLFLCMMTVLIKGGNSEGARLIICFGATFLLAATIFIAKHQFSLYEWLPGLALFAISAIHIITHNLIWEEALLWGMLALSYWTILLCVSRFNNAQMKLSLIFLLFIAGFEAVYGVFNRVTGDVVALGLWEKIYYSDSATGTFVNRNHFASYLALTWPITLASVSMLFRRKRSLRLTLHIVFSVVFLFGLLLSKSRMGLFVGLTGIGLYVFWQSRQEFRLSRKVAVALLVGGFIVLLVAALWLGVADIGERYAVLGKSSALRLAIWKSMFDLPINLWFFGIGVNEFEQRFPIVQPMTLLKRMVYAHNDYLQIFLEIGVVGVASFLLACFLFLKKGLSIAPMDAKRRAAWCGVTAVLLHELVDFNMHMPALTVVFFILMGIGFNNYAYSKSGKPKPVSFTKLFAQRG